MLPSFTLLAHRAVIALAIGAPSLCAAAAPLIEIDAGHTLAARGARAAVDGRNELEFNVDLSRKIAQRLAAQGDRLRMANDPVRAKENFAQRTSAGKGADFFLSVHHDSASEKYLQQITDANGKRWEDRDGRFQGFSLFVDPADAKGVACARAIGARLIESGERPSRYHADPRFGESRAFVDEKLGVHAFAGLAVARLRQAPMALLEAGVIVNPAESIRLRRPEVQDAIASAVALGLKDCRP